MTGPYNNKSQESLRRLSFIKILLVLNNPLIGQDILVTGAIKTWFGCSNIRGYICLIASIVAIVLV